MPDRAVINPIQRKSFLAAYALTGSTHEACKIAKVAPKKIKTWLDAETGDPGFLADIEEAREEFVQTMEREAFTRAVQGTSMPVIHHGEVVTVCVDKHGNILANKKDPDFFKEVPLIEHKKSDALLMFLLKAERPDKYRENSSIDLTTKGAPVKAFVGIDTDKV